MSEVTTARRWMKHREKQGVWHLAIDCNKEVQPGLKITACRGDMLYGSLGPIIQLFDELPKGVKCVRCTKLWLESNTANG